MPIILIALLAGLAVTLFIVGIALPSRADPVQSRLEAYGSRVPTLEEIEMDRPFVERAIKPLLHGMASVVMRFTPNASVESSRLKLEMSGNPNNWTPTDFLGVRVLSALGCGALAFVLQWLGNAALGPLVLYSVIGAALGFLLPVFWLGQQIKARQKQIQKAMPDALDLLSINVEAGLALDAAMAKVAEKFDNELGRAFGRVIAEVRIGRQRREALRDMAERAGVPDLSNFVTALIQAEQLGVSMSKVLRIQSDQMRVKRRQRAEEEAHKAPNKMSVVLVLFLLPGLFIVILGPAIPRMCRQFNISDLCK